MCSWRYTIIEATRRTVDGRGRHSCKTGIGTSRRGWHTQTCLCTSEHHGDGQGCCKEPTYQIAAHSDQRARFYARISVFIETCKGPPFASTCRKYFLLRHGRNSLCTSYPVRASRSSIIEAAGRSVGAAGRWLCKSRGGLQHLPRLRRAAPRPETAGLECIQLRACVCQITAWCDDRKGRDGCFNVFALAKFHAAGIFSISSICSDRAETCRAYASW